MERWMTFRRIHSDRGLIQSVPNHALASLVDKAFFQTYYCFWQLAELASFSSNIGD